MTFSYYYLYLKQYLLEDGRRIVGFDKSILDNKDALDEFLTARDEAACYKYEISRKAGYNVYGAQELAMETLLANLKELEPTEEEKKAEAQYQEE